MHRTYHSRISNATCFTANSDSDYMGYLLVLISVTCFGAMALLARITYAAGVDTYSLLALRFLIATVVMLGVVWLRRPARFPRGAALRRYILMGTVYAAMSWAYFDALHYAASATVALVLYAAPILVALIAAALRIDRFGLAELLALAISTTGLVLVLGGTLQGSLTGFTIAFIAAFFYAVYIVIGSRVGADADADPIAAASVVLATAGIIFAGISLGSGPHLPHTPGAWAAVGCIAVFSTALAIAAFNAGILRLGPTLASVLASVEPVVTVTLGILFLDEHPGPRTLFGGLLIIGAATGLSLVRARRKSGSVQGNIATMPQSQKN
jgi:drug/metabolite transporter (DMT)-like permease